MKRQAFQRGEIRDEDDNIIRTGAYGKNTAFATKDNKGILDYIINNFQALFDMISGAYVYVDELPISGDIAKLYVVKSTGKTYRWDGTQFILVSAAADGLSAYEIAKQNGFAGTEKEWLESIRGEKGESITGATVDSDGYLILNLSSGQSIKTELKPIIEAKQYADSAAASATQARESEVNAATSLSQANTSALQASASATDAASSASKAKQSETSAANSESNASKSEINAKASMNAAAISATSASTSATNAGVSEGHAATSETNARQALAETQKIKEEIDSALAEVTRFAKYAGSVDNYSDLPTEGVNTGDVWNIVNADATNQIKAGDNVIWNGKAWDNLSGFVDLSNYPTNKDVAKAVVATTYSGDTITFIHKDGSKSTATIGDTSHAIRADQDGDGNVITNTYYKITDAANVHQSFQRQINTKQDKLTLDTTPTAGSKNPVTSGGVKTALDGKVNASDVATSAAANKLLKLNSFGGLSANVDGLGTGNNYNNRKTTANINIIDGALHYYLATSSMSTGKPPHDCMILHMAWDNRGFGRQIAFPDGNDEKKVAFYTRGSDSDGVFDKEWVKVPTVNLIATHTENGLMSSTDKTKLDGISDIYTFTKTLTITTDWQDTGIHGGQKNTANYDLPSGSYIVQVSGMNSNATNIYGEIFTGIMSFYAYETNSNEYDEITLHKAGHTSNNNTIYLRTLRHPRSTIKALTLQIKSNVNLGESPYTFKFRKLI